MNEKTLNSLLGQEKQKTQPFNNQRNQVSVFYFIHLCEWIGSSSLSDFRVVFLVEKEEKHVLLLISDQSGSSHRTLQTFLSLTETETQWCGSDQIHLSWNVCPSILGNHLRKYISLWTNIRSPHNRFLHMTFVLTLKIAHVISTRAMHLAPSTRIEILFICVHASVGIVVVVVTVFFLVTHSRALVSN